MTRNIVTGTVIVHILMNRYRFIQQGIMSWGDKMLRRILAYRQTHPPPRPPNM
jgi:hypothetical protein